MSIKPGETAPNFTLKSQDDRDWTLAEQRGKRVVLMWYPLDWSPTCEKENCRIGNDVDLADDDDTVIVGLSRDSVWSHKAWKKERGLKHDLLADPMLEVTKKYDLVHPKVPFISHRATVIVDRNGKVAWTAVQESTGEERDWNAVRRALAQVD